jgi:hypothetical protein
MGSRISTIPVDLSALSWPGSSPSKTGVNALMSRPCLLPLPTLPRVRGRVGRGKGVDGRDERRQDSEIVVVG